MSRQWPDREVSEIASRQATMIDHDTLRGLGIPAKSIAAACRRGRLHRVHHSVYSIVPPRARPRLAAEHAALLACGPHAVLSHHTAARVHGLTLPAPLERDRQVQLTVPPNGPGRGRPGLTVHRSDDLPRAEATRRGGLRVTSVARTVVDCSARLDPRGLEALVDQALRATSATKLRDAVARHPRRRGTPLLRAILDPERPSRETRSRTEARLLAMLTRAGLPTPEANVPIGRLIPDLLWREFRVIGEYDSDAFHFGPHGIRRTWERHRVLQDQGFDVVHITWDDLSRHRERVLVRITLALARGGWTPVDQT